MCMKVFLPKSALAFLEPFTHSLESQSRESRQLVHRSSEGLLSSFLAGPRIS
jgi:hypothetical protein